MRRVTLTIFLILVAATAPPATAQQQWHQPRDMGMPAVDFEPPSPESLRLELAGGLAAYVVADDLVPLVRFTALIGAGDADGAGVAYGAALRSGPADMAPGEFADVLEQMAALYVVEQSHVETRVTLEAPREDGAAALRLFVRVLRQPLAGEVPAAAAGDAVERATGESGPVMYEGSLATAVEQLEGVVFGAHAYTGTSSAAGPAAFREQFVVPANVVLAVAGDFDPAAMRANLREHFDDWSGEAVGLPRHPMPQAPEARAIHTFDVDKLQGWVAIGHELPEVPMRDEAPLLVMNYILGGGHFDTRLFRATRDRRGLTNDDSGFPEQGFRGPGLYSFRTYGRPEVVRLLIHLTLQEIERIRQEPVSEEELFVAQGALADGEFSLWFRNGAATATTYAREWLRYASHERSASWRDRVRAVTAADVLDAARRYLHPERMQIAIVGPIDAIRAAAPMEDEPGLDAFAR